MMTALLVGTASCQIASRAHIIFDIVDKLQKNMGDVLTSLLFCAGILVSRCSRTAEPWF